MRFIVPHPLMIVSLTLFSHLCFIECRKPKRYHPIRHTDSWNDISDKDSLKPFHFSICDRQKFQIKCPTHARISVEGAYYSDSQTCGDSGRKKQHQSSESVCDASNFRKKMVEHCQNREECGFKVKANSLGDSKNCRQELRVSYKCRPSQFMSDVFCENSTAELKCRNSQQGISIYSANFGRSSTSNDIGLCGNDSSVSSSSGDCSVDVYEQVSDLCQKRKSCIFGVNTETLTLSSTACPIGSQKYLTLVHICVDEHVFHVESEESEITFHKVWTPYKQSIKQATSKNMETTTWKSLQFLPDTVKAMSDAAAEIPPNIVDATITFRANESDMNLILMDSRCSSDSEIISFDSIRSCIPVYLPNLIHMAFVIIQTCIYLAEHYESLSLYFSLSASGGFIIFLIVFVAFQICASKPDPKTVNRQSSRAISRTPSTIGERMSTSIHREISFREPSVLNAESLFDLDDFDDIMTSRRRTSSRGNSTLNSVRTYQL